MTESTSIHRVAQLYMTADAFHVNLMKSLLRIKYICPNSHTVVLKSFFLKLGYHSYFLSLIKYICLNSHNLFFGPFFSSNNSFFFFQIILIKMILKNSKYVFIINKTYDAYIKKIQYKRQIRYITKTHNASQSLYMRCVA